MVSALQITDLTKEYPGFKLDHVSFTLPQGTIMGLIGENGAGKMCIRDRNINFQRFIQYKYRSEVSA